MKEFRHRRYRILGLLGEGGMGRVHLAEDLLEDRERVALKVYPAGTSADLLRREFLALRALRHPGIARAYHFGASESDGAPFFTMERIAGEPLDRRLAAARAAGPRALLPEGLDLFLQAASAAHHLHRRSLLHLDLKPGNMLVAGRAGDPGRPLLVLIDFGLLRVLDSGGAPPHRGTVPFMAPEVFGGGAIDARADVYALGVTFYLALTGRYPVESGSVEGWIRAHREAIPAPAPELPPPLERLLLRALAKDPQRRFADGGSLARALLSLRAELGLGGPPATELPVEPELVGRQKELAAFRRWIGAGAARPPLLLVEGADGSGKSRLLSEMETTLEMRKRAVIHLRPAASGRGLLAEVVRRSALLYPARMSQGRTGPGGKLLAHFAGLGMTDGRTRRLLSMTPPEEARRIVRSLAVERVGALLRDEETYLLIDDLDEAGAEAREVVSDLAAWLLARPSPGKARGGIIAAVRRAPETNEPFRALLAARGVNAEPLSLGPLSRLETRKLIRRAFPAAGGRKVSWLEVHRRSGGVPLYVLEELRALSEGLETPAPDADHRERLRRRIRALSPERRELASLLFVGGRPLPLEVLARSARIPLERAVQECRALAFAGILAPGHGRRVRFVHRSVEEVAGGLVGPDRRTDLHLRLAEALNARPGSPGGEDLRADAAHHFFEAGKRDEAIALARSLGSGGEPGLLPSGGADDRGHSRLFEVLGRAAREAGSRSPGRRLLLEALGDRLFLAGRFEEARQAYRGLAAASRRGFGRARALRKLAAACHRSGERREAERLLLEVLEILGKGTLSRSPEAREERLACLAELALLYHFLKDTARARERAREGLRLYRPGPRSRSREGGGRAARSLQRAIDLHGVAGQIAIRSLALAEAVAVLRRGLRLATAAVAPVNAALLLNNLGLALHLESRLGEAGSAFRRAERIARSLGDTSALAAIRSNVAQIHAKRGRFAAAFRELEKLEEEPAVRQSPRLRLSFLYSRALVRSLAGAPQAGWEEVAALAEEIGDRFLADFARVYRAEERMAQGRWSEALAALRRVRDPFAAALARARKDRIEAALGLGAPSGPHRPPGPRPSGAPSGDRLPALMEAWNRLHRAQALADRGDLLPARGEFLAASRFFRSRGISPGFIESALLLADLELRRAGNVRGDGRGGGARSLGEARRWMERAREAPADSADGDSPRLRSLRLALIGARAEVRAALLGSDLEPAMARARDLLAAGGGDPRLGGLPDLAMEHEAVRAAVARLSGDPGEERVARELWEKGRREVARRLEPAERRAYLRVDLFDRLGLGELGPPPRPLSWPRWATGALRESLRVLARTTRDGEPVAARTGEALGAVGRPWGATAVLLLTSEPASGPRVAAAWPPGTGRAGFRRLIGALRAALPSLKPLVPLSFASGKNAALVSPVFEGGKPAGALAAFVPTGRAAAVGVELLPVLADALSAAGVLRRGPAAVDARGPGPGEDQVVVPLPAGGALTQPLPGPTAARTRTVDLPGRSHVLGLIGKSPAARKVAALIAVAASSELPVLITGESGVGKEVVARAIHLAGPRSQAPFISQSASAIPAGLLEADLFGYERGSFTGADRTRSGFIMKAQGGTFVLDEIADAEPSTQAKILRVIEERALRPVGGRQASPIDVRFIALTQRDLQSMIAGGVFRKDLFYRLAGLRIEVPPLRERVEDVGLLFEHFLRQTLGHAPRIAPRARQALESHSWPGNVRELQTTARRVALSLEDGARVVSESDVQAALDVEKPALAAGPLPSGLLRSHPYPELRRALELEHLKSLWLRHGGDLTGVAGELGTTVRTVYRRFERLGLKPRGFRQIKGGPNDLG